MNAKLIELNGGPAPWEEPGETEARKVLEEILSDYESFIVVGVRRDPDEKLETETLWFSGSRVRRRVSGYDLTGALHVILRQLEDGEP